MNKSKLPSDHILPPPIISYQNLHLRIDKNFVKIQVKVLSKRNEILKQYHLHKIQLWSISHLIGLNNLKIIAGGYKIKLNL